MGPALGSDAVGESCRLLAVVLHRREPIDGYLWLAGRHTRMEAGDREGQTSG